MASQTDKLAGFRRIAAALGQSNYRAFTIGNSISLIGTWMQRVAVGWLAWQLTHSGTWLGSGRLRRSLSDLMIGPLAGALADRPSACARSCSPSSWRWSRRAPGGPRRCRRHRPSSALFTPTVALGVANALNQPARLALIPSLVEREHCRRRSRSIRSSSTVRASSDRRSPVSSSPMAASRSPSGKRRELRRLPGGARLRQAGSR